jgi:hypothetical protein
MKLWRFRGFPHHLSNVDGRALRRGGDGGYLCQEEFLNASCVVLLEHEMVKII